MTMSSKTLPLHLQDAKTDECRELLPSLPIEKGWVGTSFLHLYQGFWYITSLLDGVLSAQRHFRALDSDIILVTSPKSGTTWLKAILFALFNRSCYSEPSKKSNHPLLQKNPHDLVPFLESLGVEDPNLDLSSFTSPRLLSTHMAFVSLPGSVKESKCKLVYLCRNPKDTFVSLWHFINKLRVKEMELDECFDKFCRGVSMGGPYWDHVLGYYMASLDMPHKLLFVKYEDMKEKHGEQLKLLANFLGCPFSEDEEASGAVDEIMRLCSFNNLSRQKPNQIEKNSLGVETNLFFRKGEVGDWVNYLTPQMIERIDDITKDKFHASGLKL